MDFGVERGNSIDVHGVESGNSCKRSIDSVIFCENVDCGIMEGSGCILDMDMMGAHTLGCTLAHAHIQI